MVVSKGEGRRTTGWSNEPNGLPSLTNFLDSGDLHKTVATQPEATTLLQQFIKTKKNKKKNGVLLFYESPLWFALRFYYPPPLGAIKWAPCAGQRSDQVIPGPIYDQVHLVRSDQVHLVMTRYTWSDDQVPGQPQLHMTNTKVSSHVGHSCTEEIMIQQFTRKIT